MIECDFSSIDGVRLDGLTLCKHTFDLFGRIRNEVGGVSRLRRRPSPLEKRLLDELLPICAWVQASYGPGRYISVCWKSGSQQYDAEIFQVGAAVDAQGIPAASYLEVTCVMHPNEYLMRERLDTEGVSFGLSGLRRNKNGTIDSKVVAVSRDKQVEAFSKLVSQRITEKVAKNYPPSTTLVVSCNLDTIYLEDEWRQLISLVRSSIRTPAFWEICLIDSVGGHVSFI